MSGGAESLLNADFSLAARGAHRRLNIPFTTCRELSIEQEGGGTLVPIPTHLEFEGERFDSARSGIDIGAGRGVLRFLRRMGSDTIGVNIGAGRRTWI